MRVRVAIVVSVGVALVGAGVVLVGAAPRSDEAAVTGMDEATAARTEFLRRFERGLRGDWWAEFTWEREQDGEVVLEGTIHEVNLPPERARTGFGDASYQRGALVVRCVELEDVDECRPPERVRPLDEQAEVDVRRLRERTDPERGDLQVVARGPRTVAGRDAPCFELRPRSGSSGTTTLSCLDERGVPLLYIVQRPDSTDTRRAVATDAATRADLEAIVAGFPPDAFVMPVPPAGESGPLPELT